MMVREIKTKVQTRCITPWHLKHLNLQVGEKLPVPTLSLETTTSFIEVAASASEAAVEPQRVPHNWYVFFFKFVNATHHILTFF